MSALRGIIMKIFKKTISVLTAFGLMLSSNIASISANDEGNYESYGRGAKPITDPAILEYYESLQNNQEELAMPRVVFPNSVDLSTSPYFPPIGNQGQMESCVGWATTYYTFTYQVNKMNGITTTSNNAFSPSWTWNYLNNGINTGINVLNALNVLKNQGAVHNNEMPHSTTASSYDYSWSNNIPAMTEALNTRVDYYSLKSVSGTGTKITNNKDSDLEPIKTKLLEDKPLIVSTYSELGLSNWSIKTNSQNQYVAYRARLCDPELLGGHCMTIVGYDDNVTLDVNGNGTIEDSEKGAFKIANSWGTSWKNSGYIWALYDALNSVSANTTNNWQLNESGTRCPIFSFDSSNNYFYYMEVGNHDVDFVGKIDISTNYRNQINVEIGNCLATNSTMQNSVKICNLNSLTDSYDLQRIVPFNGSILLDYGNCTGTSNISDYSTGYRWFVKVSDSSSAGTLNNIYYKIMDSKQNTIVNFGQLPPLSNGISHIISRPINLIKGDLDFDGDITIADLATAQTYVGGGYVESFSNVMKYLADVDYDGDIDSNDVSIISGYLLG